MLYNRCTGIYKFGNNTHPRRIRCRSNLGHIFRKKKVRLIGWEIQYVTHIIVRKVLIFLIDTFVLSSGK